MVQTINALDKYLVKHRTNKPEAVQRIQTGEVSVNSVVVLDESTQVHESNAILLNGDALTLRELDILMHKPAGTICSNIDEVYPSLFNYLLDKASEPALSQDG